MKKRIVLPMLIGLLTVFISGCSCYVPLFRPENCLNTYNSYWDDFAGSIEVGRIYHYSNNGFNPKMHFAVIQILDDGYVLVTRKTEYDDIWDTSIKITDSCTFLIATSFAYADGAKLRDGDYRCTGTWKYKTKGGEDKTVYVFSDLRQPRKEEPVREENLDGQNQTKARAEAAAEKLKDYLNFCNTYWDEFSGTLKVGKTYHYTNDIKDEFLKFRILQAFPKVGALIYRSSFMEQGREVCKDCYFLVITSFAYADNALFRDGEYRCLGTWQYETKSENTKTVYVLLDEANPGECPEDIQKEESAEPEGKNRI